MKLKKTLTAALLAGTTALAMSSANAFFGGWGPWDWFDNGWYDYPYYYGGYPGYYGGYPGYYGGYPGYYGGYPGYYGGYPGYYGGYPGYGYGYPAYGYLPQPPAAAATTTK